MIFPLVNLACNFEGSLPDRSNPLAAPKLTYQIAKFIAFELDARGQFLTLDHILSVASRTSLPHHMLTNTKEDNLALALLKAFIPPTGLGFSTLGFHVVNYFYQGDLSTKAD